MNLLFVASRFPYPPSQGDRVRAYHQLKLLSKYHSITLITPVTHEANESIAAIRPFCKRIVGIPMQRHRQALNLLKAPFEHWPLQTLYFYNPQIARAIDEICSQEKIDLIHVQMIRMAPSVAHIHHIPVVIDLIDSLALNMRRRAQRERWWLVAQIVEQEAIRTQRYERELANRFNHLLICSALDKTAIGNQDSIHIVRQGVDTTFFRSLSAQRASNTIVFSGNMGYFPNADAAEYFITTILPIIRQHIPEVRFQVVGGGASKRLLALSNEPGVELVGYTTEINKYLSAATVAVAPMRSGSGMQFKVLEAMACGVPIVVTSFALGGIEVNHGEHLLVADQPQAVADSVVRLLKDATLRHTLATNSRRLVEEKYSWEQSVSTLEQIYDLALQMHYQQTASSPGTQVT